MPRTRFAGARWAVDQAAQLQQPVDEQVGLGGLTESSSAISR